MSPCSRADLRVGPELYRADAAALFTRDAPLAVRVIPLALGRDTGVRDLALLPDGRLLVLAGPAQGHNPALQDLALDLARPGPARREVAASTPRER